MGPVGMGGLRERSRIEAHQLTTSALPCRGHARGLTIFNSGGYCCRFAVAGGHEVSRWRRPGRGGTGPPGAGAAGRRGDDRGRGRRPGGREAVPGVADVGEPVAAGPGRRRPGGAGLQGGGRRAVQAHSRPAGRAGGGAGCGPGGGRLCGSVLDAGPDRGPGVAAVRGGVHAGRDGCAAAPARLERAGPGPPGRRAGRGQDRRLAGGDLAGHKRTAADLGAWLCFEDESGQGLRRPKGRTWGRRGHTPVVRVTGSSNRRVSLAALIAVKPGCRPRLIYRVHKNRRRRGDKRKGFTETGHARLLDAAHQQLGGPLVVVWDNLTTHVSDAMTDLIAARDWRTIYRLPPYAHELNPVEPVWFNLKRSLANLAKRNLTQLTALIKTRLRRMQYRPGLLDGFLASTGLDLTPFCNPRN